MPPQTQNAWQFAHTQGDAYSYENPDDHSDWFARIVAPLVPRVVTALLPAAAGTIVAGINRAFPSVAPQLYPECAMVTNPYGYSPGAQELEEQVTGFAASVGIGVAVTSRKRTCHEQAALYRAGRTTAAPTTSQHEFGTAFDCVPTSGLSRYGATKAQGIAWLVQVAEAFGGYGLAESDHAHITVWSNDTWQWFIWLRGLGFSIPIPGRRGRR